MALSGATLSSGAREITIRAQGIITESIKQSAFVWVMATINLCKLLYSLRNTLVLLTRLHAPCLRVFYLMCRPRRLARQRLLIDENS